MQDGRNAMLGISQQGYVVGRRAEWGKPIKTLWRLIPGVALAIAPLFNHLRKQKSSRDSLQQTRSTYVPRFHVS